MLLFRGKTGEIIFSQKSERNFNPFRPSQFRYFYEFLAYKLGL